jgi:hypothetical protein
MKTKGFPAAKFEIWKVLSLEDTFGRHIDDT